MADRGPHDRALRALRAFGLALPGAHRKSPWPGHDDLAVNDKTFAYLSLPGDPLSLGVKLPASAPLALELPFCTPSPYGLGKSGWVTAKVPADEDVPEDMFRAWIEESYRAQAPKKRLKELDAGAAKKAATTTTTKRAKTSATKKTAAKKTAKRAR